MSYSAGSIVWARFDGYAFWPSILISEPNDQQQITVLFLADNGRIAKLDRNRIIPFEGLDEYWDHARNLRTVKKVGNLSIYLMYIVQRTVKNYFDNYLI